MTFPFTPKFSPHLGDVNFFPHWIELPELTLEYRDTKIVELIANQVGIFIKHDLIPFEHIFCPVRVCILLSNQKPVPTYIVCHSKWGYWRQKILIQGSKVIEKYASSLRNFNLHCQGVFKDHILVCEDCI